MLETLIRRILQSSSNRLKSIWISCSLVMVRSNLSENETQTHVHFKSNARHHTHIHRGLYANRIIAHCEVRVACGWLHPFRMVVDITNDYYTQMKNTNDMLLLYRRGLKYADACSAISMRWFSSFFSILPDFNGDSMDGTHRDIECTSTHCTTGWKIGLNSQRVEFVKWIKCTMAVPHLG